MIKKENKNNKKYYNKFNISDIANYNWEMSGLNNKILSSPIYNTKNPILKNFINIYENIIKFMLKSTDILNNFKNYNIK